MQIASALHASGVPIGAPTKDSPFYNAGNFTPHVVVRNLLGSAQSVTITAEYPGTVSAEQSTLSVGPYSTVDEPLDYVLSELPAPVPYCSIRIQYSGPPGSVVAQVSGVEQKSNLVVDSHVVNEGNGWAGSGANPWHLDNQTESVVFLTNMSGQSARVAFDVQASGVHYYLTNLSLAPRETRAIDLRQLRDAQQADFKGNKIPLGATDGSVFWIRLDNVPVMGRVVVMQRKQGVASNYDCCTCPCPPNLIGGLQVLNSSVTLISGGTYSFSAIATYENCNSVISYSNVNYASLWSATPSTVATMSTYTVTAHGGGTANVTATFQGCAQFYQDPEYHTCTCQRQVSYGGTASVYVQVPTSLRVLGVAVLPTGTTGNYGCVPGYPYGIIVDIQYKVLDQSGTAILSSIMIPHETGVLFSGTTYNNNVGPSRISDTSEYTAADGTYHDAPVGVCTIAPFSGKQAKQNVTILVNSSSYPVRSQTFTAGSSGSGHGTIGNGSDISASR